MCRIQGTEAKRLVHLGVKVDCQEHSWGTVAKFIDPDGDLCALRDDETFEQQIETFIQ